MRRTDFERLAAAILALLIQIAAIALFTVGETQKAPISEPGNELVYIRAVQMPALTTLSTATRSTKPPDKPKAQTAGITPDIAQQTNDAVPSIPPIDAPAIEWERSMRDAARRFVDDQAVQESQGHTLNSRPDVLVLPDTSKQPHRAGDTEHREGGVVITWLNERCYHASDPLVATRVVCKVRSMSERRSEELAEALEKAVKPKYLRAPLPLPKTPSSPIGSEQQGQSDITIDQ